MVISMVVVALFAFPAGCQGGRKVGLAAVANSYPPASSFGAGLGVLIAQAIAAAILIAGVLAVLWFTVIKDRTRQTALRYYIAMMGAWLGATLAGAAVAFALVGMVAASPAAQGAPIEAAYWTGLRADMEAFKTGAKVGTPLFDVRNIGEDGDLSGLRRRVERLKDALGVFCDAPAKRGEEARRQIAAAKGSDAVRQQLLADWDLREQAVTGQVRRYCRTMRDAAREADDAIDLLRDDRDWNLEGRETVMFDNRRSREKFDDHMNALQAVRGANADFGAAMDAIYAATRAAPFGAKPFIAPAEPDSSARRGG